MKTPNNKPPRSAQRLLLRFLRDDLEEEVVGDLDEKFFITVEKKSLFRAQLNYWYQVFSYMRPFAVRKSKHHHQTNYAMFRNYFKIGYRNLLRNKGYSFINIGGLAVGIAVAMLIGLWIKDELSYETSFENYTRIAQVMQHQTFNGHKVSGSSIPFPLRAELEKTYGDDFKYLVMSSWTGEHILSYGESKFSKKGNYMEADAPKLLSLNMVKGSADGLKTPNSILLSQSVATAFFGDKDPINELMKIDNKLDVKVTGVYADLPSNTSLRSVSFIAP